VTASVESIAVENDSQFPPQPASESPSMHQPAETVLAVLPGSNEGERVIMVMVSSVMASNIAKVAISTESHSGGEGTSRIEMRQQSWCEQFGWYTQSRVLLEPQQVAALRNSLGQTARSTSLDRRFSRIPSAAGFQPRLVHADSA
jgi:hypothetical protein